MTVREALLAILAEGSCYGYQLRLEFERRTGGTWPLNVGQVYNTLDRLERDDCVTRTLDDDQGHRFYAITATGRTEANEWMLAPTPQAPSARDELATRIALAVTLAGNDALAAIAAQRASTIVELEVMRGRIQSEPDQSTAAELARGLILDATLTQLVARLEWLDRAESRILTSTPEAVEPLGLATDAPGRGRPKAYFASE
jgi:DNA-binding PadR family transcriptional regulator